MSIIIAMAALVGLVLFLIWQPDEASVQTLTPEMLSDCIQSGIPESACSAQLLLAKKRLILINFSLQPEDPEQQFLTLNKGDTKLVVFNVVAPPHESLNLTLSIASVDAPDTLPKGLAAELDKTQLFIPPEQGEEESKVRGNVTLTITTDPAIEEGRYGLVIGTMSSDGRGMGTALYVQVK